MDDATLSGSAEAVEPQEPENTNALTAEEPEGAQPEADEESTATPDDAQAADDATGDEPEAGEDEPADAEPEDEKRARKRSRYQERINELTGRMRAAEREAAEAKKRAERLEQRLKAQSVEQPKEADFDSLDEYQAALAAYHVQRATLKEREGDVEDARTAAQEAEQQALALARTAFNERAAAFAETVPDFQQAINDPTLTISEEVARQLLHAERGPEVAYYLAKNRAEAARLADMSNPLDVAREIGRLEGRLSAPPPKRTTQAPPPVKTVAKGSGSQSDFDPEKASVEEMEAWLRKRNLL
ncbi:MAG: hypothetical protein D6773_11360 [Alphaproteobacteria bacterium]|nr:MAG: hypothetical protein D6773_11360 [Alphaproteobacteria bacterium]